MCTYVFQIPHLIASKEHVLELHWTSLDLLAGLHGCLGIDLYTYRCVLHYDFEICLSLTIQRL
jgi:hypothetical protein